MKRLLKKMALLAAITHFVTHVNAQSDSSFLIGDAPPPFQYSKWLKGAPVKEFKKDHLYVVEFWATWCGPCIAAMPHLSELARQYKGKATFIGVNVWEKVGDKPYESSLPAVNRFVSSMGEKMDYNVAADNDAMFMAKNWLEKAGVPGIPVTFLIHGGKLVWMGHPKMLDTSIVLALSGKLNLEELREGHIQSLAAHKKARSDDKAMLTPINAAIAAGDYAKAFGLMDKAIKEKPMLRYTMNITRFKTMLDHVGEEEALAFAEEFKKKEGERSVIYFAQVIIEKEGLSKGTYLYAAEAFKKATEGQANVNPLFYDYIARGYSQAGDYMNAVAAGELAVKFADEAVKNGKFVGVIHDYTVAEYAEKLKAYKKKL